MCGIFGVIGKKDNASQVVLEGLKKLEYRGYDSWGIAVEKNRRLLRQRQVGKIGQAKTSLPRATIGLGHTRWATHGGVTLGNAHPHFDCSRRLCLVHNGIVENFASLKSNLKSHRFSSETDTEVALHLIEEKAKKISVFKALQQSFKQLVGMNALILLDAAGQELLAVKNGSPLIIGLSQTAQYIASDVWALLDHTNQVVFLEDNQLVKLKADGVEFYDIRTGKKLNPKIVSLNWQSEQSRLGRFHHYMEKEIYDQPKVLDNLSRLSKNTLNSVVKLIKSSPRTYLLGCGTAAYAALFGEYLLAQAGYEAEAITGSEFAKSNKLLSQEKNLIVFSQSGETIDVIDAVNQAHAKKMKITAITNVLGSTLYRRADKRILLSAGQEVAVASTKTFTAKLAIIIQLAYLLDNRLPQAQDLIAQAAQACQQICQGNLRQKIKTCANQIKDVDHIFTIGRLASFPLALEAALKIKEVSYIHAEGYASGELKHGPIALIDQGTPCLVMAPAGQTFNDVVSACHELQARGGLIVAISPKKDKVFDIHLPVPDLEAATAIPSIVVAQLLAYDLAICRGLNPDKPRNLAKSVTVK